MSCEGEQPFAYLLVSLVLLHPVKIGRGFLLLSGGKVLVGKGVYNRGGIIVDILGDKNKLVGCFNLSSFVSQTLSIASVSLTTVCG